VKGIGKGKADAYGKQLLACVAAHPPDTALDHGAPSEAAADGALASGERKRKASRGTTAAPAAHVPPPLSSEQSRAVELVRSGASIFLTGGAGERRSSAASARSTCTDAVPAAAHTGTGKSFTLQTIIDVLVGIHGEECVFVTASTGMAACNIGALDQPAA
jgi:hypothetical protein